MKKAKCILTLKENSVRFQERVTKNYFVLNTQHTCPVSGACAAPNQPSEVWRLSCKQFESYAKVVYVFIVGFANPGVLIHACPYLYY